MAAWSLIFPFKVMVSSHTAPHTALVWRTLGPRGDTAAQHHTESQRRSWAWSPGRLLLGWELFQTPFLATFPRCERQHTQGAVSAEVEQLLMEGRGAHDPKFWDFSLLGPGELERA